MRRICSALWIALLMCHSLTAQQRNFIWYFGSYAGLDFHTDPPTILLDGRYSGGSACGSICDTSGALLFYNEPDTIYTAQHDTMTWGTDLYGDPVSSSGIVVPWPDHPFVYYIFMAKGPGSPDYDPGAFYHRVDMSYFGGSGACVQKAVPLHDSVVTMVTAIPHGNGTDYWALFHEWGSDKFLAFLVGANGLVTTPVISSAGEIHHLVSATEGVGFMRPSSDGTQLAVCKYRNLGGPGYLDLFAFDPWTGAVSYRTRVESEQKFFALEFSPNGQFLYATIFNCDIALTNDIVQYDISVIDSAAIAASRTVLYAATYQTNCDGSFGVPALAPDNKIYVAIRWSTSLGVVNEPDLPGVACDFQYNAQSLGGRINNLGLPNQVKFRDSTNTAIAETHGGSGGPILWPIPATTEVMLKLSIAVPKNARVRWIDELGRVLRVEELRGNGPWRLDRAGLAAGCYTVAIITHDGAVIDTGRVILE